MRAANKLGVVACAAALLLPAIAQGGERPPSGATYSDGGSNIIKAIKGGKQVKVSIGFYECGNNVPFSLSDPLKVSRKGKYSFEGQAKNVIGDKYKLTIKGEVKSAKKAVQTTTIEKGNCNESQNVTLKTN